MSASAANATSPGSPHLYLIGCLLSGSYSRSAEDRLGSTAGSGQKRTQGNVRLYVVNPELCTTAQSGARKGRASRRPRTAVATSLRHTKLLCQNKGYTSTMNNGPKFVGSDPVCLLATHSRERFSPSFPYEHALKRR